MEVEQRGCSGFYPGASLPGSGFSFLSPKASSVLCSPWASALPSSLSSALVLPFAVSLSHRQTHLCVNLISSPASPVSQRIPHDTPPPPSGVSSTVLAHIQVQVRPAPSLPAELHWSLPSGLSFVPPASAPPHHSITALFLGWSLSFLTVLSHFLLADSHLSTASNPSI